MKTLGNAVTPELSQQIIERFDSSVVKAEELAGYGWEQVVRLTVTEGWIEITLSVLGTCASLSLWFVRSYVISRASEDNKKEAGDFSLATLLAVWLLLIPCMAVPARDALLKVAAPEGYIIKSIVQ